MREVEAQAIGGDERALLGDVAAQAVAQRRVQQVRGRVVGPDGITPLGIDLEGLSAVFAT